MSPRLVWAVAFSGLLAWLAIEPLFGYLFLVVYWGFLPGLSVLLALVHQVVRASRPVAGAFAIVTGLACVATFGVIATQEGLEYAKVRRERARRTEEYARARAEIAGMSLRELVDVAVEDRRGMRGEEALLRAAGGLEREIAKCSTESEEAVYVTRRLAYGGGFDLGSLELRAREACPALREPLRDAIFEGIAERPGAAESPDLIVELMDLGGEALARADARVHFRGDAVRAAIEELIRSEQPNGYYRAQRILELGLVPAGSGTEPPLSELLREVASRDDPEWPEGAPAEEQALFRALVAIEPR